MGEADQLRVVHVSSVETTLRDLKQPAKQISLPMRCAFDPSVKGLIRYDDGDLVAYREMMGREPPISDSDQWLFTGRKKKDKDILNATILTEKKTYKPDPKQKDKQKKGKGK